MKAARLKWAYAGHVAKNHQIDGKYTGVDTGVDTGATLDERNYES